MPPHEHGLQLSAEAITAYHHCSVLEVLHADV